MSGKTGFICVVDDDFSNLEAVGSLLSAIGLQMVLFENPRLFLEHARYHPVSLAIVDVWMTGREDPGVQRIALAQGAIAFLKKPFSETALLQAIRKVLPE